MERHERQAPFCGIVPLSGEENAAPVRALFDLVPPAEYSVVVS